MKLLEIARTHQSGFTIYAFFFDLTLPKSIAYVRHKDDWKDYPLGFRRCDFQQIKELKYQ